MDRWQKTKYYCIIGLISKATEDATSKAVKIHVFDYPTVVWRPLSNEPPRISAQTLYWQKLESLGYIFVADSIDLSSFKFLQWAPKDARVLKQECIMTLQGHPRSSIMAPIESAYMTSYSTSRLNSNLGPILPRFRDIRAFVRWKPLFHHPTPIRAKISGCSLWCRPVMLGLQWANVTYLLEKTT